MADSILRLKVESQEYDNKLKQAAQGLTRYADQCRKVGGTLEVVEKETLDYVRAIGQMDTTSRTATGKLAEMKKVFVELSAQYKQMTDAEKASPLGKALAASLDQLKPRIQESKAQLESINNELSGSKFGQFGGMIDSLGQKMGLNVNITELLTSKTALLSAGIGAAGAIVGKATQEWAKYNAELSKQDQITTVTTGLKGADSDRMTNQARALTDTYNVDFREAINAANTLMTQFGQTGDQAMSLIRDGMQGMIQGDGPKLLSMIQQYAPAFRDAGVTASQLVAVIQNSEGGIFTDQNMNAIVMGIKNIRLMTKATSDALAQLGIDGQQMSQQLRDGSLTIFDALKQVATQIQGVNSNSQAAGEVMQQVFGRQGAMAGTKLGEAIATLNTNLEETKRQTGEVGDAYNDLYNANVKLNGAIRDCFEYDGWDQMATGIKANLVSALASVLNYLGKIKGALGGFSVNQQQGETRNGGGQFIDRAVDRLRGGNTPGKQQIYTRQIQAYSGKILDINDQIRQIQEKAAQDMDGNMAVVYEKQIRNLENRKQAIQRNMAEYDKRAQAVLNGTDTKSVPITNPVTTVTTPKTTTTHKTTPQETASNKVKEAERTYAETLLKNSIRLEAGMDTTLEYKKRELSAQERLFDAYNDAYATYQDPAYKKASTEAAEKIKTLAGEVKAASDAQEAAMKSARELDAAQRKLADAQQKLAEARATGSATAVYKAQQEVDKRQKVVEQVQYVADVKAGKMPTLPENMKAEMVVTANTDEAVRALQAIQDIKIDSKSFTVSTDDADAMARLREISGIKIAPKSFTVSTYDADAMARLREIRGIKIAPKSFTVSTDDADAMARLREIRGIKIAPKSFTVSTDDADAMARLREIDGVTIDDKTFSVSVNDADTLAKVREIAGVTIDDKTMTVTATTDEAMRALQAIQGIKIDSKSFTVSTDDADAMARLREIDGVTIDDKTFSVSVNDADTLAKVREIADVTIDDKTLTVTATTDEAVRALQAIQGVMIQPKSFDISTDDADAMAKVSEIDGVTIGPKTFTVTADDENVLAKLREILDKLSEIQGVAIDTKTFTISTDNEEALAKVREIQDLTIDPKTVKVVQDVRAQGEKSSFDNLVETVQAEIKFDQMKVDETALHTLLQAALQNGLDGLALSYEGIQEKIAKGIDIPDSTWEELYDEINEKLKSMGIDPIQIPIETVGKDVKAITKAASMAADAVGNIGAAFNSIEDPAAKVMGTVLQAIASIALGFAQASASPAVTSTGWGWLAWLGAGTAALATTVATVHSLTGYAEGGMIKGNSYSGDRIGGLVDGSQLVGLNAGEVVLNASQQNMLAQNLQGAGGGNTVRVVGTLRGNDIVLAVDRSLQASGRGELLTWG